MEGIKLGFGDIGIVTTVFHNSRLRNQAIAFVTPFICTDGTVVARAVDELARKFLQMKVVLDKQNQVCLASAVVLDTYQVCNRNPVSKLTELEGAKAPTRVLTCAI